MSTGFKAHTFEPLSAGNSEDNNTISVQEALTLLEVMATNLTGEGACLPEEQAKLWFRKVEALDLAMESLRKWSCESRQKWILMDEKLPEEGKRVLFWLDKLNVYGDQSLKYTLDAIWNEEVQAWRDTATHWMALPEPPKK